MAISSNSGKSASTGVSSREPVEYVPDDLFDEGVAQLERPRPFRRAAVEDLALASGEGGDHAGAAALQLVVMRRHLVADGVHQRLRFLHRPVEGHRAVEAVLLAP